MTTRRFALIALAIVMAGLSLAPAQAQEGPRTIPVMVLLHDNPYHLVPERVNARVGDTVEFTVVNQGSSPHNLIVCGDGANPSASCNERWGFTPMLEPQGQATITVVVPKAGTFEYYCDIPGHKAGGMVGTLVVEGSAQERNESPGLGLVGLMAGLAAAGLVVARRR